MVSLREMELKGMPRGRAQLSLSSPTEKGAIGSNRKLDELLMVSGRLGANSLESVKLLLLNRFNLIDQQTGSAEKRPRPAHR